MNTLPTCSQMSAGSRLQLRVGSQIYFGKDEKTRFSFDDVARAVELAKQKAGLSFLLIWCTGSPNEYLKIVNICKEQDVEPYLWFPILSDTHSVRPNHKNTVKLYNNTRGHGVSGKWTGIEDGSEDFLFLCPNDNETVNLVFKHYCDLIKFADFKAVMFDRIRYPSFSNGFESLFTCFCEKCIAKYHTQSDEKLTDVQDRAKHLLLNLKDNISVNSGSLKTFLYANGFKEFFEFRENNIFNVAKKFASYSRKQGLKVGLDLFSLSLSFSVSQNYKRLCSLCDFVKPMLYCHGTGPACLPLELQSLIIALKIFCPQKNSTEIDQIAKALTSLNFYSNSKDLMANGVLENVISSQLADLRNSGISTTVLAGIESISDARHGCSIDHEIMNKYLSKLSPNANGLIASWNLMYTNSSILEQIGQFVLPE